MKNPPAFDSPVHKPGAANADAVFESVAELFALLSTPVRLKIIGALCNGEKNV